MEISERFNIIQMAKRIDDYIKFNLMNVLDYTVRTEPPRWQEHGVHLAINHNVDVEVTAILHWATRNTASQQHSLDIRKFDEGVGQRLCPRYQLPLPLLVVMLPGWQTGHLPRIVRT